MAQAPLLKTDAGRTRQTRPTASGIKDAAPHMGHFNALRLPGLVPAMHVLQLRCNWRRRQRPADGHEHPPRRRLGEQ